MTSPKISIESMFFYLHENHKFKPNVGKSYHTWILWDMLSDSFFLGNPPWKPDRLPLPPICRVKTRWLRFREGTFGTFFSRTSLEGSFEWMVQW